MMLCIEILCLTVNLLAVTSSVVTGGCSEEQPAWRPLPSCRASSEGRVHQPPPSYRNTLLVSRLTEILVLEPLQIYFGPDEVKACILTCGGLCPGLNTVIRELVCGLSHMYNVNSIFGIQVCVLLLIAIYDPNELLKL